jgi:hypothetical protein
MVTTVAALVIVLGLMVVLARSVREHSAERLTRSLLVKLDGLMAEYHDRNKSLPKVSPFPPRPADQAGGAGLKGSGQGGGVKDGGRGEQKKSSGPGDEGRDVGRNVEPGGRPGEESAATGGASRLAALLPDAVSPASAPPPEDALPDEALLQKAAKLNNRDFVQALRREAVGASSSDGSDRSPAESGAEPPAEPAGDVHPGLSDASGDPGGFGRRFGDLPVSVYDEVTLRDAWGTPIVFMPSMHPAVGMAPSPEDKPFFLSAGPDGRFSTPADNLYSYEVK